MKQKNFLKRLLAKNDKARTCVLLCLMVFVSLLNAQNTLGQERTVTGKVVDDTSTPLPGLSVILKGTKNGTQTDFDGFYSITIPDTGEEVLEYHYLGYTSESIKVGLQKEIDVTMGTDIDALDEVIVVGYGVQKKASVVGAIGMINSKELMKQGNVSNLTNALTGMIPGLSVLSRSGLPGGDFDSNTKIFQPAEILIRGKTTWNDASPLILVDGVERPMGDVDISEVESVSVLKDASATAVFGVKGGNGVILITTKRGKTGKSKFNITAEMSYETPSDQVEIADIPESAIARNIGLERVRRFNQGYWDDNYFSDEEVGYYRDGTYPYAYQNMNWADLLYKDFTKSYRVNATASGGTEKVKYFASASFNHVGDVMNSQDLGQGYTPSYSYDRFNIRTNFDFQISKTTKLSANFSGMHGVRTTPPSGTREGLFSGTSQFSGDRPIVVYEDGIYGSRDGDFANSYFNLNFMGVETQPRTQVNMDYTLSQDLNVLVNGLKFTARLAYDTTFRTVGRKVKDDGYTTKAIARNFYTEGGFYDYDTKTYMIPDAVTGEVIQADMSDGGPYASYDDPVSGQEGFGFAKEPNRYEAETIESGSNNSINKSERDLYYEAALRYNRTFGVHDVTGLAMFSRQYTERGSNFPEKREDWVGRFTYGFDSKYFIEANGAFNGSEKFGPGYRFEFFPSVAAGWMISKENFMQKATWLNKLKVRFSYGKVGNDRLNTGSQWPYATVWGTYNYGPSGKTYYGYPDSYTNNSGNQYSEGNPGNPDLRWETALKQNLGFEVSAFNNTLSISVDLFKEDREDMLVGADDRENTVPPLFGRPAPPGNFGKAKSHGGEIDIQYNNSIGDVNYWVLANMAIARSEVIYRESTDLTLPHQRPEGFPIGQTRTQLGVGFINSWDDLYGVTGGPNSGSNAFILPGDAILLDFNSDGRYDSGTDNVPYGFPTYPQNNYGIGFGGDYMGFDLTVRFVGAYNTTRRVNPSLFWRDNMYTPTDILDKTWSPEYNNSNPSYPALGLEVKTYNPLGHYPETDGSFLRLQSAQFGYSLPKKWITPLRLSSFKLYVNGNNLFLWTNMPNDGVGLDDPGKNYPTKKQFNMGLNIGF